MPQYTYRCATCEFYEERSVRIAERHDQRCTECECLLEKVITGEVAFLGALWDKKINFQSQLGKSFSTNQELRDYEKANPDARVMSKSDPEYRQLYDKARNASDVTAKKLGYRDQDHRVQSVKQGKPSPSADK